MVADCWVFVDMGRFYLQSNTARIMPITLTINGMSCFSGLTNYFNMSPAMDVEARILIIRSTSISAE